MSLVSFQSMADEDARKFSGSAWKGSCVSLPYTQQAPVLAGSGCPPPCQGSLVEVALGELRLLLHWENKGSTYWNCSVQLLSHVRLDPMNPSTPGLKPMSIESVMPSSHLILCHPLLFLPPIPPSIRVFSNESTLHMRWPNYCTRLPYCRLPPLCPSSVGLGQAGRGYGMLLPEQAGLCSLASLPSCASPQVRILHISS
ncbi:unnamed protein product [Rangifer tarandus platyrhynchus]|uniref:Uncharacterized protein n=2 Tax=Rangifer tarandus platyrhynchus TaxID=3082113 RepID=A0ABN8ZVG6_RANTA|nr:unnamed protein product [Rangifer tarandus platyrhynchus]